MSEATTETKPAEKPVETIADRLKRRHKEAEKAAERLKSDPPPEPPGGAGDVTQEASGDRPEAASPNAESPAPTVGDSGGIAPLPSADPAPAPAPAAFRPPDAQLDHMVSAACGKYAATVKEMEEARQAWLNTVAYANSFPDYPEMRIRGIALVKGVPDPFDGSGAS